MKILVFSDIHGSIARLEKMLEIFERSSFELMIIPGDFLNHGPRNGLPEFYDPAKCAERLNCYRDKIFAVRGNCDAEVDQMILNFPIMSGFSQLFADKVRLFVHHGHIYDLEQLERFVPKSDDRFKSIIISGHTHIPILKDEYGYTFLNPGSITFPKGGSKPSYAALDTASGEIVLTELAAANK